MKGKYYAVCEILTGAITYSGGDEYSELCCAKALVPGTVYAGARLEEIAVVKARERAEAYRQQGYTMINQGTATREQRNTQRSSKGF